jgi:hypothetical protein
MRDGETAQVSANLTASMSQSVLERAAYSQGTEPTWRCGLWTEPAVDNRAGDVWSGRADDLHSDVPPAGALQLHGQWMFHGLVCGQDWRRRSTYRIELQSRAALGLVRVTGSCIWLLCGPLSHPRRQPAESDCSNVGGSWGRRNGAAGARTLGTAWLHAATTGEMAQRLR